jgi:CBS domain-containing protein
MMPTVKDFMTKTVITIDVHRTVFDAAELMSYKGVGCLVIMEGEMPRGIVTERDFVRRVVAKKRPLDIKISEIMSKTLITISPDASLKEAARTMTNNRIRRLPVLEGNRLVGIIVASDFVRQLSKKTITEEILQAITRFPLSPVLDSALDAT